MASEEEELRSVTLQNAQSILLARRRAEEELRKQSEWLRVTLSSIGDAVISTDAEGRVTFMNGVAETLTGWRQAEALGRPLPDVFQIFDEASRRAAENPVEKVLRLGRVVGLANHTILIAKDGTERAIDDSAAPIHDEHQSVVGCVLVFRDVSDRRRSEDEAQRAVVERLRHATLSADIGVALTGTGTLQGMLQACAESMVRNLDAALARIWTLNEAAATLELQASAGMYSHLDGPHGSVPVGKFKIGMIAQERKPHLTNTVLGDPRVPEQEWARREGLVAFAGYPLVAGDRLAGVLAMFARQSLNESTLDALASAASAVALGIQRKEMENELRRVAADLSEADRRKDEFLATLAHELRNPLAPLRNGLQLMQLAGTDSNAIEQARGMMERQLEQMVRLVDDLMDVSRISRGKIELRRESVPLAAVLTSAIETSRPLIEQMGHKLTVSLPEQPIIVNADLTRLAQVFLNLLNNAAKYSDRGGQIWLTATIKDEGGRMKRERMKAEG